MVVKSFIGSVHPLYAPRFTLLLFFSWPPVYEMCPNYEVVMFQPQTGTPTDLGSISIFYINILFSPAPPFTPDTQCPPGGATSSLPFPLYLVDLLAPTQDHFTTQASPIPTQHTEVLHSLKQNMLPPQIPLPYHAFRIPDAEPLPPPKYLLTSHSAVSDPPPPTCFIREA